MKKICVKTINKCSHLKVASPHFLSKSKRKPAKQVYLGKIAAGKLTTCNFNKKTSSQVPFTADIRQRVIKIKKMFDAF